MADISREEVSEIFIEILEIGYEQFSQVSRPVITGMQGAQYRLLFYLNKIPMESMTNLGRTMHISKQHMTTLVDSLIKEGYVERQADPHDRRVICVKITEDGRNKLREIRQQLKENIISRIERLQPSDLELLYVAVQNLISISKKYR